MTPEEVFAQLRDLHRPDVDTAIGYGFDLRPVLIFGVMIVAIAGFRAWVRWRRSRARFNQVDASLSPAEQRDQIAQILSDSPRRVVRTSIPPAFFAPPPRVSAEDAEELRRWAQQRSG